MKQEFFKMFFQSTCKQLFLLATLVITSSTQSVAQSTTQPGLPMYEDDIIRARVLGASFDQSGRLQASLIIENKTAQDLLLAFESLYPEVISNLGETGSCYLNGLKALNLSKPTDPNRYSRLKPKQKLTVSLNRCDKIQASRTNSISINMPLVRLENERPTTPFTLDISGIPVRR
jgi:hypothetical protein